MQNFLFSIGTKAAFGKGQIEQLPAFAKECGSKALLVYGGGHIKRSGLYDVIMGKLNEAGIETYELSGVNPNPDISSVAEGVGICKENGVDFIVAAGGGSCIDCAKAISAAACLKLDPWDVIVHSSEVIKQTLPVIAIPTTAAAGSEMDCNFVISNSGEKFCGASYEVRPKYAILDPEYTYSVSAYQTACGCADILSHLMEVYFNGEDAYLQERMLEAAMKTVIHYAPVAIKEPDSYEARANLMWASCIAINGTCSYGKAGLWPIHSIEQVLHRYADFTHGHGVAAITPAWMRHTLNDRTRALFETFGETVLGLRGTETEEAHAENAVRGIESFYDELGLQRGLECLGINKDFNVKEASEIAAADGLEHCFAPLYPRDIQQILEDSF